MATLRPIFTDQLSHTLPSLDNISASDTVLMCELMEESQHVKHHPKKLILWFAAMRTFSEELKSKGISVRYVKLTDPSNTQTYTTEINRALNEVTCEKIILTEPNDYRLKMMVHSWKTDLKTQIEIFNDSRFLSSSAEFTLWAKNKTQLRMEYFYREMRKKYKILMEPDGLPTGGQWNFDHENRKSAPKNFASIKRISHKKSPELLEAIKLVQEHFPDHFGDVEPFHFAISRDQALLELDHFIETLLPYFGDYQDAMLRNEPYLYHSLLSSYINLGLLLPLEICQKAENAYREHKVPLNAAEGFIRQILGWREFVRGIYHLNMPEYAQMNFFDAKTPLPDFYWGAKTNMACISEAVDHTKVHAYSHHIQRLMVTGNFALLTGLDVKEVEQWYLAVYSDAYEWVEMPNTLGMALYADGGIFASKPYAASGQYINKMSNFCKSCIYDVKDSLGENACPFNALYWDFMQRNRNKLAQQHRLSFIYKTWDKFEPAKQNALIKKAAKTLEQLHSGNL